MEAGTNTLPPIPTAEVILPGEAKILVRGIGLHAAVAIYRRHEGELTAWFTKMLERGEPGSPSLNLAQASTLIEGLLVGAPDLAVDIIAAGMGFAADPGAIALASGLGLGVQMDALTKIADLTFTSEMPPKKFIETVVRLASATVSLAQPAMAA